MQNYMYKYALNVCEKQGILEDRRQGTENRAIREQSDQNIRNPKSQIRYPITQLRHVTR